MKNEHPTSSSTTHNGGASDLFVAALHVVVALCDVVRNMHVVRDELAAVRHARDGRRVLVEEVDLLQGETLGLRRSSASALFAG